MAKIKTVYVCRECGCDSVKWQGRCPGCGAWNTMEEEIIAGKKNGVIPFEGYLSSTKPVSINDVKTKEEKRMILNNEELKGVLGGGIVPGSLILVGGEPGSKIYTAFADSI